MSKNRKQVFQIPSEEKQREYERLARLQYDPQVVAESTKRWKGYTTEQRMRIGEEGNAIYSDLVDAIEAGKANDSEEVQVIIARWHQHLRYFYEPTLDLLRGLGDLYNTHPDFIANFKKMHPDLPAYLQEAITQYVDDLETVEIERLLAEDEQTEPPTAKQAKETKNARR